MDLADLTEDDLDRYAHQHRSRATALRPFLVWCEATDLGQELFPPKRPDLQPAVTLADEDRWRHVQLLLRDDTARLYTRIVGLLCCFTPNLWPACAACAPTRSPSPPMASPGHVRHLPIELPAPSTI